MKDIISKRRKELGLTQQELADKLFVSDKVISKWETGKSVPDTSILVELANVLEISLDELLKSGKEGTEYSIKTAVADKVDVKYKNVLLFTSLFIVIGTVLFSVAKILDYKDYYQEYQVTITIFYVLAILFLISSLFYFLITRNKLIIDYPRFKEVDNNYIKKLIIIYGIATFIITLVITITHRLIIFELLIVLAIAGLIEAGVYLLVFYIINKIKNK
jgi:membrane-anchored DNA-binding protein, putative